MPPPPRARTALQAMKNIGFASKESSPVLKKLLEVYDNNWEYIEENNYQVLIDSILEAQEAKAAGSEKQDAVPGDYPEYQRKRLRKLSENPSSSMLDSDGPGETLLKKPKVEADDSPEAHLGERRADPIQLQVDNRGRAETVSPGVDNRGRTEPVSPQADNRGKMTEPMLPQPSSAERANHDLSPINHREPRASARASKASAAQENTEQASLLTYSRGKLPAGERSKNLISFKEPKIEPDTEVQENSKTTPPASSKDKEADNDLEFEVPIAMISPSHPNPARDEAHKYQRSQGDSSVREISSLEVNAPESLAAEGAHKGKGKGNLSDISLENGKASQFVTPQDASSSTITIASSCTGAVKLLLSFNSPDLRMPRLDAFFKMMDERCMQSNKISPPALSLQKVLKEMCQFASELTTEPSDDRQGKVLDGMPACSVNGSLNDHHSTQEVHHHK